MKFISPGVRVLDDNISLIQFLIAILRRKSKDASST
jgi:hypothetical protein